MSSGLVFSKSPEDEELDRKKAELAALEMDLIQRELEETSCKSVLAVHVKNTFNLENSPRLSKTVNNSSKIKPK